MARVNLKSPVGRLKIGEGPDAFTLHVKSPSALERMAIVDAILAASMEGLQRTLNLLVIGWEDVETPEGTAIPFERLGEDERPVNCLDKFLVALPISRQFEVNAALLAFVGLHQYATGVAETLGRLTGRSIDIRPTGEPAKSSSATTSNGS